MPPPKPPTPRLLRSFSTSVPVCKAIAPLSLTRMPPYPYGPALHYKQSNSGLYGGSTIQFGNKVSTKNEIKTRRSWHPNIQQKRLWSDALQKFISVKVQARVLRTIDKVGGIDAYLLGDKPARIKDLGVEGWRLRWKVLRTPSVQARIKEERIRLGLPAEGYVTPVVQDIEVGNGVEEEVERVSGDIVEQMESEGAQEEAFAPEEGEGAFEEGSEKEETLQERVAKTARDIELSHGNRSQSRQPLRRKTSEARDDTHHLVGIRKKEDEAPIGDEGSRKGAGERTAEPGVVQANDSRSIASRLRGLFKR